MKESHEEVLWKASTEGNLGLVEQYLKKPGLDVNWRDPECLRSSFYRACGHGRVEVVKLMLKDPRIAVSLTNKDSATPFYIACQEGQMEVIRILKDDGRIDLNQHRDNGSTPFYVACEKARFDVVKELMSYPIIDVNKARDDGATAFYVACFKGNLEIVKLMVKDPRIDINKARDFGATPFYVACSHGRVEVVQELLKEPRVDLNRTEKDGATSFYIACQEGQLEVVKLLLKDPRISVNRPTNTGATPLFIASQNGHLEIVKWILTRADIDLDAKWKGQKSALEQAKAKKRDEIVELLEEFQRDRSRTVWRMQKDFGLLDEEASRAFVLVVFLSDEYLGFSQNLMYYNSAIFRFFKIASQLPQELQMILCRRVFDLPFIIIHSTDIRASVSWVLSKLTR